MMNEIFLTCFKLWRQNADYAETHTMSFETARAQGRAEAYKAICDIANAIIDEKYDEARNLLDTLKDRA